jgi:hypothetical protein
MAVARRQLFTVPGGDSVSGKATYRDLAGPLLGRTAGRKAIQRQLSRVASFVRILSCVTFVSWKAVQND